MWHREFKNHGRQSGSLGLATYHCLVCASYKEIRGCQVSMNQVTIMQPSHSLTYPSQYCVHTCRYLTRHKLNDRTKKEGTERVRRCPSFFSLIENPSRPPSSCQSPSSTPITTPIFSWEVLLVYLLLNRSR